MEHLRSSNLGFNSMFQILKLVFSNWWHFNGFPKSKNIANFSYATNPNLKTLQALESKSNILKKGL
jgi:hypothetical protein